MDHNAERHLYETDRRAWAQHVAPNWTAMLRTADAERFEFLRNAASPELRRAVWALADDELQRRLKDAQQ